MEDKNTNIESKRKLADEELSDILGVGFVSVNQELKSSNFENLPQLESTSNAENSTTVNNLNVNVNIAGKGVNTRTPEKEIKTIVQNAIPTLSNDATDLKKNSPEIFNINSQQNLNDVHMNFENNNESYNTSFDANMGTYITNPELIVDLPDINEISSYSHSTVDGNRIYQNNTRQVLNNIVSYSMSDQSILNLSPYSSVDSTMQNYTENDFSINNLQVEPNFGNSMEQVSSLFQERRRIELEDHFQEKTKKLQQEVLFDRQTQSETDLYDASRVGVNLGLNPSRPMDSPAKSFRHLNASSSDISQFMSKMNSPPTWRTVLG